MHENTTPAGLPPLATANGATGHRYHWQTNSHPATAGISQPAGRLRPAAFGMSPACQGHAHASCPDRLAATMQRRCGCGCHRRAERLAYTFYLLAAAAAVIGQVWVAVEHIPWPPGWPTWARVAVIVPFAFCLELLGMVTAALADTRMRLGERALGLRTFSATVAAVAVVVIVAGHWPDPYLVTGFGAFSAAAYLLWTLHSGARRRDALRTAGLLNRVAPAYGWYRWLPIIGRPGWKITHRARELAIEQGLGLHESLQAAEQELRETARRPAIAAAVRAAVRANHPDPIMAEIAVRTLDHDRIATELENQADYTGWATRLAAAVSASPPPSSHGHEPDSECPDTNECPEAGNVEDTCSPVESEQPPTSSRIHTASPDGPVLKRAGRKGYETAARIAEAMARTPQPTQVDVARELGISDRTVRRHLDKIKLDQSN